MDNDIKSDLKRIVRDTEIKVAESILRWKHKREGKKIPDKQGLKQRSQLITDQAHETLSRRGRTVWKEFKKAYQKGLNKEDHSD